MIKWTDEQLQAINSRDKNLLVSASAGSGKTTVMIERIVSLMLGSPRVPIKNFLVVTFTKASAADMKSKLINKLIDIPEPDAFILQQIEDVQTSDISNLHSFCSRLISTYFYKVQIDPNFHVIDEVESNLLKEKAATKLFEESEKNNSEQHFKLFEIFQEKRSDDGLKNVIFKLNDFLNSILNGNNFLTKKIEEAHNLNLNFNECAQIINNYVCEQIKEDAALFNDFAEKCAKIGCENYASHFGELASSLLAVNEKKSYIVNAKNIFDITFATTPRVKEDFKFLAEEAASLKKFVKQHISNYRKNFISSDEKILACGLKFGKEILVSLLSLVQRFNEIYLELKHEVNGLDFCDLEKYALEILGDSAIVSDVKARYKYVFVDEYQDINEVQEKIIQLVSGDNNRFMVGDIKQSIYRFRFCDPEIFLNTYKNYSGSTKNSEVIKLNCNFRSDKKILKFVDMIFSDVMTKNFGGIDYKTDSLFVAGENNLDKENSVNLCFIDTEKPNQEKKPAQGIYSVKNHMQEITEEESSAIGEAIVVAAKIAELVAFDNPQRISYSDIAILSQSRNDKTSKFLETLKALGIPVSSDEKFEITKKNHIEEILSFVKLCVNPYDDLACYKVLKSKLFEFSDNDLANIRRQNPSAKFCDLVFSVADSLEITLKQKQENFVNEYNKFSALAKVLNIKSFVSKVVDEFCLKQIWLSFAGGTEIVSQIEEFINALPEVYPFEFDFENFSANLANEIGDGAVKFMSVHASKGIEFKVVFLINTAKPFTFKSLNGDLLISNRLGAGINYFDFENRVKYVSLPYSAIRLIEKRRLVEENQRVLYVALTRAVQKLYVICSKNKSSLCEKFPSRPNSFSNWFEPIICKELAGNHNGIINFEAYKIADLTFNEHKTNPELLIKPVSAEKYQPYIYPFIGSSLVPLKNSVSKIIANKFNAKQSKQADGSDLEFDDEYEEFENQQTETNVSFAERGTVYHKIFEKLDLKNMQDIQNKLRIIIKENLSEHERLLIDETKILKILNLPFFQNITDSDIVLKEREFTANMPASLINRDALNSDNFILQGVVDLLIIKQDKIIILDYKTGTLTPEKQEKYSLQLNLYANAVSRAFGLSVSHKYICLIDSIKIIEI